MKIYGHPMSTCTRKVLATLAETGTPHELIVIDFATQEHKSPGYLARQPFGQLPALEDDGFAMYESRAMCRYIDDKAGHKVTPNNLHARAAMEQWISVEQSNFTPHAMKFVYHHVFQRPQEPAVLEAAAQSVEKCVQIMDAQLAKTAFIAGDQFTLADISFAPYFEYTAATPLKDLYAKYPHVTAWWSKVSERPSWQKATGRA